jgi:hypothetical protein
MPVETGRVIKRKHVSLPNGSTVDIPVITQITFLDVVDQSQEREFHLENGGAGKRDVRVASIPGSGGATDETGSGSGLKVERIDTWRVLDVVEKGQETFFYPDSKTVQEPPNAPPFFTTHEKTRVVKYINTPDDGNWIKSELIDRWKYADTVEQGQETEYFLFNPPDNQAIGGITIGTDSDGITTVAVDPGFADISDSANGIDPPWRTDPFQNIVDFGRTTPTPPVGLTAWTGQSVFVAPARDHAHALMDSGPNGFFINVKGAGTFTGTWSIAAAFDIPLSAAPVPEEWTHWTSPSGGTAICSAVVTTASGATGDTVTFDMTGAIFTLDPPDQGLGAMRWKIVSSTEVTTTGASFGMVDNLEPVS